MSLVFVRHSGDWSLFGERHWYAMMAALQRQPCTRRILGLDAEWFFTSPISVVQIASATHCFVIHLAFMNNRELPGVVKEVLEDGSIIKCGVGISGDVSRLQREQHLTMQGTLDEDTFSVLLSLSEPGKTSLAALASIVGGVTLQKSKKLTCSNWERGLSPPQISYAADDAVASFLVGQRIMAVAEQKGFLSANRFNAGAWLSHWSVHAAAAHRCAIRLLSCKRAAAEVDSASTEVIATTGEREMEKDDGAKVLPQPLLPGRDGPTAEGNQQRAGASPATAGDRYGGEPAGRLGPSRVVVFDADGTAFTEVLRACAVECVSIRKVATVREYDPNQPAFPLEIQLTEAASSQRKAPACLCVYNAAGRCELGERCPYAHSVDKLSEAARVLLTDADGFACRLCLDAAGVLTRFAVVPSRFRPSLPPPFNVPCDEDYIPVCEKCRLFIMDYIDVAVNAFYHTDEDIFHAIKKRTEEVTRCVQISKTLLNVQMQGNTPTATQEEMWSFLQQHWQLAWATVSHDAETHQASPEEATTSTEATSLSPEVITRLANVPVDRIKPCVAISLLVGGRLDKAAAFVAQWHHYVKVVIGMLDLPHRVRSAEEWHRYTLLKAPRELGSKFEELGDSTFQ